MHIESRCPSCKRLNSFAEHLAGTRTTCPHCSNVVEVPFPPLELPEEKTSGGSIVYRHEPSAREWEPALGDDQQIEQISDHIEEHLGPVDCVLHEIVSDLIHVDVHVVSSSQDRPFQTLVTSGMSERPMSVPDEAHEFQFAELMLCLPPDWPLSQEALSQEEFGWPLYWLRMLARFPHQYETWLFHGHTIPNGDPPEQFADNAPFTGWIILPPQLTPDAFHVLHPAPEKSIHLLAIFPLYQEEMDLKLEVGTDALEERFARHGITELIDINRINVAGESDF